MAASFLGRNLVGLSLISKRRASRSSPEMYAELT